MDISFLSNYDFYILVLALSALGFSIYSFARTRLKMSKSEQIKVVHEVLLMYLTMFDKYRSYLENYRDDTTNSYVRTAYLGLLDPLEFYANLSKKKQIDKEFDFIMYPYFSGACSEYNHYGNLNLDSYPKVQQLWKKWGCKNKVKKRGTVPSDLEF